MHGRAKNWYVFPHSSWFTISLTTIQSYDSLEKRTLWPVKLFQPSSKAASTSLWSRDCRCLGTGSQVRLKSNNKQNSRVFIFAVCVSLTCKPPRSCSERWSQPPASRRRGSGHRSWRDQTGFSDQTASTAAQEDCTRLRKKWIFTSGWSLQHPTRIVVCIQFVSIDVASQRCWDSHHPPFWQRTMLPQDYGFCNPNTSQKVAG